MTIHVELNNESHAYMANRLAKNVIRSVLLAEYYLLGVEKAYLPLQGNIISQRVPSCKW